MDEEQKKKNIKILWWILGVLVIFSILFYIWFIFQPSKNLVAKCIDNCIPVMRDCIDSACKQQRIIDPNFTCTPEYQNYSCLPKYNNCVNSC